MLSLTGAPLLNRRNAVRLGSGGLAAATVASGWRSAEAHNLTVLEANKALVHRLFAEGVNGRNAAVIRELYAPEFVDRGTWARQMPGPGGMPLTIDQFDTELPNVTMTVDVTIAEEDMVAVVATWRSTHPPAGSHVTGRTMHLIRIADELIVEEWSSGWDWLAQRGDQMEAIAPLARARCGGRAVHCRRMGPL
jgi:ketosteroid isomerase-like protein